jgi:hypothetical protein
MLGHAVSKGTSLRNDDGSPVVRSEPILTREVFDRIGVQLSSRGKRGEPTKRSTSLLLRVIYCGVCGEPVYRFNGGRHSQFPRYRCRSIQRRKPCGNRTIRLDHIDELVEGVVLRMLGTSERLERNRDSRSDHSAELAAPEHANVTQIAQSARCHRRIIHAITAEWCGCPPCGSGWWAGDCQRAGRVSSSRRRPRCRPVPESQRCAREGCTRRKVEGKEYCTALCFILAREIGKAEDLCRRTLPRSLVRTRWC